MEITPTCAGEYARKMKWVRINYDLAKSNIEKLLEGAIEVVLKPEYRANQRMLKFYPECKFFKNKEFILVKDPTGELIIRCLYKHGLKWRLPTPPPTDQSLLGRNYRLDDQEGPTDPG